MPSMANRANYDNPQVAAAVNPTVVGYHHGQYKVRTWRVYADNVSQAQSPTTTQAGYQRVSYTESVYSIC